MNYGFENLLRGLWRIRTAVDGFADHCLATRPRDPFLLKSDAKISNKENTLQTFLRFSLIFFNQLLQLKENQKLIGLKLNSLFRSVRPLGDSFSKP